MFTSSKSSHTWRHLCMGSTTTIECLLIACKRNKRSQVFSGEILIISLWEFMSVACICVSNLFFLFFFALCTNPPYILYKIQVLCFLKKKYHRSILLMLLQMEKNTKAFCSCAGMENITDIVFFIFLWDILRYWDTPPPLLIFGQWTETLRIFVTWLLSTYTSYLPMNTHFVTLEIDRDILPLWVGQEMVCFYLHQDTEQPKLF